MHILKLSYRDSDGVLREGEFFSGFGMAYRTNYEIFEPILETQVNSVGYFSFTIYPSHPLYDFIDQPKSLLEIVRYNIDEPLFIGRMAECRKGLYNEKILTFESELAFLIDSVRTNFASDVGYSTAYWLDEILRFHNTHAGNFGDIYQTYIGHKFERGNVSESISALITQPNAEEFKGTFSTLEIIQKLLLEKFGGVLKIRHEDGVNFIDWLDEDDLHVSSQKIELSKNLISLEQNRVADEIVTAIRPIGDNITKSNGESAPVDIALTDASIYLSDDDIFQIIDSTVSETAVLRFTDTLYSKSLVNKYGWIQREVHFDGVTNVSALVKKAEQYLLGISENQTITINAVDLANSDNSLENFSAGEIVMVNSPIHSLEEKKMFVNSIRLDLSDPTACEIMLGNQSETITSQSVRGGSSTAPGVSYSGSGGGSGCECSGDVDDVLSENSENPVQNKVITIMLNELKEKINDIELSGGNVAADFLTEDGFGNLRFYNGKFQYYNTDTQAWTDCEVTDSNSYILQMVPQVMKRVLGWYDHNAGHYKLLFEEPADTVIDGQVATVVDSVYIVRKLGSMPESVDDADCVQVDVIDRSDFGIHKNKAYIDKSFTPSDGEIWYYKLIPHSTSGFYNNTNVNGTRGLEARDYFLLGYKVDKNDSNPDTRVTYTDDCVGFTPAAMNYTAGVFDYGTWGILNPWFLSENKPCAVKFDGTVDYYMKADDYSLREDGTASDYDNVDYQGNMMAQIPKVYLKRWEDGNYRYCQISDKKINDDFKCYAHLNANQQELDYIYLPMFKGIIDSNGKMRSYAGCNPNDSKTITTDISAAQACGKGWYIWDWSSFALIQDLLVLLGKSTDSQTIYGNGCSKTSSMLTTGELYLEGQFCGYTGAANHVKVFHVEDFYGNRWEGVLGLLSNNGVYYYKMFPDYNFDCTGYTATTANIASAFGYISKCVYGEMGCMAISSGGSSTTYECDRVVGDGNGIKYPVFGSSFRSGEGVSGCFGIDISVDVSFAATGIGTSPIFKSLKG